MNNFIISKFYFQSLAFFTRKKFELHYHPNTISNKRDDIPYRVPLEPRWEKFGGKKSNTPLVFIKSKFWYLGEWETSVRQKHKSVSKSSHRKRWHINIHGSLILSKGNFAICNPTDCQSLIEDKLLTKKKKKSPRGPSWNRLSWEQNSDYINK